MLHDIMCKLHVATFCHYPCHLSDLPQTHMHVHTHIHTHTHTHTHTHRALTMGTLPSLVRDKLDVGFTVSLSAAVYAPWCSSLSRWFVLSSLWASTLDCEIAIIINIAITVEDGSCTPHDSIINKLYVSCQVFVCIEQLYYTCLSRSTRIVYCYTNFIFVYL